ncbi:MAG TPA: ferritin-like domain-containing protein [Candidatus Aquilonibacter sp.]|nr:ferritin-like domain-containing protein [Candidatus Aquilonibacter sp.]
MSREKISSSVLDPGQPQASSSKEENPLTRTSNRRSFLKKGMIAGATAGAGVLAGRIPALAQRKSNQPLSTGDIAILRFLAAAEIIETDLWQQYAELGGVTDGAQNNYQLALQQLDGDGSQYISSNTLDEHSHARFLDAYLQSKGANPVNLDKFRTLPSSQASGARQIGRLTNLTQLTIDTSWYTRYRSKNNPDFGASFPQAIKLVGKAAIPSTDSDFGPPDHIQAIANTAAFHFGFIEQGGSSLYSAMAQKVSDPEVLRIVLSIGGDEVAHFLEWVDFAGNGVQGPVAPFTDPTNGLTFPDFNATGNPLLQTNLIFPVPCEFISSSLPRCAVIRPTTPAGAAAGAVRALTDDGLFIGQSPEFFATLSTLAAAADAAQRSS